MGSNAKQFLFINKDSNGLKLNSADSYQITSHVSRNHRKWLKRERQRRLRVSRSSSGSHIGPLLHANIAETQLQWLTDSTESGSSSPFGIATTPNRQTPNPHPAEQAFDRAEYLQYHNRHDFSRSASTNDHFLYAYKGNSDPFNASIVPLTPERTQALRLALRCFVFAAWPDDAETVFRTRLGSRGSHIDLTRSLSNEAELNAILASGYLTRGGASLRDAHQCSLMHKVRSVQLLREQLQTATAPTSVFTLIRLLISLEFNSEDYISARTHIRGVRSLCARDPRLHDSFREIIRASDVWIAMALLARTDVDPRIDDPGPPCQQPWYEMLNDEQKSQFELTSLSAPLRNVVGDEIKALLLAVKELTASKQLLAQISDEWTKKQMSFWWSRRGSANAGGLINLSVNELDLARQHHTDTAGVAAAPTPTALTHYLRAALAQTIILYMNLHWLDMPIRYEYSRTPTFLSIEPILRICATHAHNNSSTHNSMPLAFSQLLLWACFLCAMGTDIFSARGSLPQFSGWPASEFVRLCERLNVGGTVGLARGLLAKVAYREGIMDEFLGVLLEMGVGEEDREDGPTGGGLEGRRESVLGFARWRRIVNHYVDDD